MLRQNDGQESELTVITVPGWRGPRLQTTASSTAAQLESGHLTSSLRLTVTV